MKTHPEREARDGEESVGVVVGNVILKDNKVLLVQEKKPHVYGIWNLPAGHVNKGETFEQAALREAKEETGYDIRVVKKLAIYQETAQSNIKHIFLAEVHGGGLTIPAEELLDVQWLSLDDIKSLEKDVKLRAPWTAEVIRMAAEVQ